MVSFSVHSGHILLHPQQLAPTLSDLYRSLKYTIFSCGITGSLVHLLFSLAIMVMLTLMPASLVHPFWILLSLTLADLGILAWFSLAHTLHVILLMGLPSIFHLLGSMFLVSDGPTKVVLCLVSLPVMALHALPYVTPTNLLVLYGKFSYVCDHTLMDVHCLLP